MITQQFQDDLKAVYAIHKINQHIKTPLNKLVKASCEWLSAMQASSQALDNLREEYSKELENIQNDHQLNMQWEKQNPERNENG